MCLTLRIGNNNWTVFRKNYIQSVQHVYSLYNIQGEARLKKKKFSVYLQATGRNGAVFFGSSKQGVFCLKGSSRGHGQVHVLLLRRWRRDGHVVLLFLGASGSWALAVVRASPWAAALALLFVLDSAVLEPDLDLLLRQIQVRGDFDAPQSGQVHVGRELTLQFQKLCAGEGCAHALAALKFAVAAFCENNTDREQQIKRFFDWGSFTSCSCTHRWRCSGTGAGPVQSKQSDRGWARGPGWCCCSWSGGTVQRGNTGRRTGRRTPWAVAVRAATGAAETQWCTADRSTTVRLSASGTIPAVRAGGAESAQRKETAAGCSRYPCR